MPEIRLPGGGQLYGAAPGQGTALTRQLAKAIERARDSATPEGLRLGAALAATQGKWQEALRLLDEAARHGAEPAIVANDRAAIDLATAASGADPLGLVTALTASDEAVHEAPADPTAWRNRALILERLELAASAREAWGRYLVVATPSAPERPEAKRRLRQLIGESAPGSCWDQTTRWQSWIANPASAGEPQIAGSDLQAVRLFVEDELMPSWAEALLRGDALLATQLGESAVRLARQITAAGGDPLAFEIVSRAVRSGTPGARAMQAYGRSRAAFRESRYEQAARGFALADQHLEAQDNPGYLRARGYRAALLARSGRPEVAEAALLRLHEAPQPSIRAYAADQLATLSVKRGAPAQALPLYEEAARVMTAQHELASLTVVQSALAQAWYSLGEPERAVQTAEESLRTGSRSCNAYARGAAVWMAGDLLLRAGAFQAASALQHESLAVERAAGDPAYIVATLQSIALNDIRLHHPDDAQAVVAEARAELRKAPSASVRETQMGFLDWIEGTALVDRDPAGAARLLANALPMLERSGRDSERTAAILSRGQALLRLGDRGAGRAELRRGIEAYERLRENVSTVADPARAFGEAEPAFDALTASLLGDGLTVDALVSSERGRRPSRFAIAGEVETVAGNSAAVLYLDQMDDRLVAWWMRAGALREWQLPWGREESRRRVEALLSAVHNGGGSAQQLSAELLAPAATDLASVDRIVVVAEDVWSMAPWSAMAHPRGGLWIDHLAISVAPSLAVALQKGPAGHEAALVVADAQRDPHDSLQLPPLRGAREEGIAVAADYPRATLLLGSRASRAEVLQHWQAADVFHFAVHAVVDETMPSAARLVLSSAGGGNVTIADISAVRFPRRPLVVLSACFTRAGRLVPLTGPMDLAREFLGSGASGVVATLRPVDDQRAAELMTAFHREYVRDGDAPAALARAIRMLRANSKRKSESTDWSAFQYIGADPQARGALPAAVDAHLGEGGERR